MLAVPLTEVDYQCMGKIAHGGWKPFWTGLVLAGENKLAGIVNGAYYDEIGFFGKESFRFYTMPEFSDISWVDSYGKKAVSSNVYLDQDGKYVVAEGFTPGMQEMFCMCQGKTETDACFLRIWLQLDCVLQNKKFSWAKMFVLCRSKPFARNLISYSQIDQKEEKQEETIERPANQVEENLVWNLISYFFHIYERYKKKFPAKISSCTVHVALSDHNSFRNTVSLRYEELVVRKLLV